MRTFLGIDSACAWFRRRIDWRPVAYVAVVVAVGMPPFVGANLYDLGRIEFALVLLLGAMSLNLAFGYGGKLAIAQPLLIAVAAYVAGILSKKLQLGLWETTVPAVLAAVAANVLLGLPSIRVRGWYLAIICFLAVSLLPNLVDLFAPWTGGADGLYGIVPVLGFGQTTPDPAFVYELIVAVVILTWIGIRNIVTSDWGVALQVARDHPIASIATGIDNTRMTTAVYVLSAIPCGLAGALYAHSEQFITADDFSLDTLLLFVGAVFLGGPGSLWGPVLGTAVFEGLILYLGPFSPYNRLALGIGVLLAALLFRGGIVRSATAMWRRIRPAADSGPELSSQGSVKLSRLERVPIFEVSGVSKHFAGNVVLRGIDLSVRGGEIVAVVGANGSGKTTLLNIVNGFIRADAGDIAIDGKSIASEPSFRRAHVGIGRTFQVPKLVAGMSVTDNVAQGIIGRSVVGVVSCLFRLPAYRRAERERRGRAEEVCRAIGFNEHEMSLPVGTLPLGLKRLVEVGRVLAGDARLMCLDEPVAGLDGSEQHRVATLMRAAATAGRAVLLIEHNLPFVLSVSDRLVLLVDGRVADVGPPAVVTDRSRLLGRYFGTFATAAEQDVATVPPARF